MNEFKPSRNLSLENLYEGREIDKSISFNRSNTMVNNSKLRMDKFGNVISKKNSSKYKICFVDEVEKNKKLVEIHRVESYKQYNQIEEKKGKLIFLQNSF